MKKKKFYVDGNNYSLFDGESVTDTLPLGNYMLQFNPMQGFYLKQINIFELPEKIYGKPKEFCERILKTYNILNESTGVFLSGLKGTGKTVTAKVLALMSGLPIINISEDYSKMGSSFVNFLHSLPNKNAIFIDEFEKVYPNIESRNVFLSILDGNFTSNNLYILTSNSSSIGEYFRNRLKRIRYHKDYNNIEDSILNEVLDDLLTNKEFKQDIINTVKSSGIVTMDIIISLIQEVNIHNLPASELVKELNIHSESVTFNIYALHESKEVYTDSTDTDQLLNRRFNLGWKSDIKDLEVGEEDVFYAFTEEEYEMKRRGNDFLITNKKDKSIKFIVKQQVSAVSKRLLF